MPACKQIFEDSCIGMGSVTEMEQRGIEVSIWIWIYKQIITQEEMFRNVSG